MRWALAAAVATSLTASTLTGLHFSGASGSSVVAAPVPAASLTPSIPPGAQGVGITEPLVITASKGTLTTVTATGPGGKPLDGTLSPDRTRWTSAPLAFNSDYNVTAAGVGVDGRPAPGLTTAFRTVAPARTLQVQYIRPTDGAQVGIGMPISIYFNRDVSDRAAVERRLSIQTSVPTEGSFHWVGKDQVNWRPREFWKAGTAVTVSSALRGVDAGAGTFGAADHKASFTIGRSQMAVGDAAKHTLTLFADGKPIRTFPASFGRPQYPTQYGMHVAFEKHVTKRMTSDSWGGPEKGEDGYYDEVLPLAVRISNNGEFVHVNGATVGQQGRSNVSHGCVNLSPANGKVFYDWVQIGDPVNIVNSTRPLTKADGDIPDWLMSWEEYKAGSALRDTSADATASSSPGPLLAR